MQPDGSGFQSFPSFLTLNGIGDSLSALFMGSDGNLWGADLQLGSPVHNGLICSVSPNGTLLQSISFAGSNGMTPQSLLEGRDGSLYGTTLAGGTVPTGSIQGGVVFTLVPAPARRK